MRFSITALAIILASSVSASPLGGRISERAMTLLDHPKLQGRTSVATFYLEFCQQSLFTFGGGRKRSDSQNVFSVIGDQDCSADIQNISGQYTNAGVSSGPNFCNIGNIYLCRDGTDCYTSFYLSQTGPNGGGPGEGDGSCEPDDGSGNTYAYMYTDSSLSTFIGACDTVAENACEYNKPQADGTFECNAVAKCYLVS